MTHDRLTVKGYTAQLDELISEPGGERAHLVSIAGTREAVRAIWARLINGESVTHWHDSSRQAFVTLAQRGAKLHGVRLPSGAYHALITTPSISDGSIILAQHANDLPTAYLNAIKRSSRVPMHHMWATWLWQQAHERDAVTRLDSLRVHAYQIHARRIPALEHALREAIVSGTIPPIQA